MYVKGKIVVDAVPRPVIVWLHGRGFPPYFCRRVPTAGEMSSRVSPAFLFGDDHDTESTDP